MVAFRLDRRLQGRIDPSDVIQEAYLDASAAPGRVSPAARRCRSSSGCGASPARSCWSCTATTWARRCGTPAARSRSTAAPCPRRPRRRWPPSCWATQTRPSEAAVRAEAKIRLQEALNGMDPIDREVLALRHFEQLTNAEAAQVLGIKEAAAGKRYVCGPWSGSRRSWRRCPAAWNCDGRSAPWTGTSQDSVSHSDSEADPLDQLAEEFAERYRRGERPSLTEYTERYPELADQIRDCSRPWW